MKVPINPYGKAKKMSEDIIKDYARTTDLGATILRYMLLLCLVNDSALCFSRRHSIIFRSFAKRILEILNLTFYSSRLCSFQKTSFSQY